ncbi:LTA synthase family protein [Exiguobacterium sp. s80]|uniref:LTA synthase family protein n=1 Tax=Exiguobacterium sp. s80 TaxID=2751209 RepID=UPI0020368C45|nr:sulfatase-like hydrolase/transferase [Exiguobacterium sp. s80]
MLKRYYQTVHYVDEAVGQMVNELKAKDMWDETLVIFYGDHDSGLTNEGSEMQQKAQIDNAVDAFALDRQVPLFIKKPNQDTGEIIQENGGQIDIAPTIVDLLNLESPYMMGNSLLDDEPNLTAFCDGSFRYKDYYYEANLKEKAGNGICYVLTEKKVEMKFCRSQVKDVRERLQLSDKITDQNALKQ